MKRNTEAVPALLGLDCGATRSVGIYQCGAVQRRWQGGPGNVSLLSDAQLVALLQSARSAHKDLPPPKAVAIGSSASARVTRRACIRPPAGI